jgi:hypothetical protein
VHFGLGEEALASVTVTWLDGSEDTIDEVQANSRVLIRPGEGLVEVSAF